MVKKETKRKSIPLTEKTQELKFGFELKDNFAKKRFNEKVDLITLRHKLATEVINLRDKVATKRHKERIDILERKFDYTD